MDAIEVTGLRKVFGSEVEAVAGLDLAVREGEIFGFLGPNGAGKSTTTKILCTLLQPTSGSARVAGFDLKTHPREIRHAIGVALQESGLDSLATGRELLILQARLHGMTGAQARSRADTMLELVGLTEAANRRLGTYSGGMRRRLDLGSALVHAPKLLFLDEPTTGLDPASRQTIWDEVARLNREEGITVFLTTQYLEEADRLCARVGIIDHGRMVAVGSPDELKAQIGAEVLTLTLPIERMESAKGALTSMPGLKEIQTDHTEMNVFLGAGSNAVVNAIRLLDDAGVSVDAVKMSAPTLDEVFLRATGSRLEGAEGAASSEPTEARKGRKKS